MEQFKPNRAIQVFVERKSLLLVVLVVILFAICAVQLFRDYSSKVAAYKDKSKQNVLKLNYISEYNKSADELKAFVSSLPTVVSSDEMVNQVADLAAKNDITINNISSSKESQRTDYSSSWSINVSVHVKSFQSLVSFFYALETSKYLFRIQSWAGSGDPKLGTIDCEVRILATQIKL
ncbi:MAG: type 4a pilus biogenesis protein PilO [Candidatus Omnitrophica bacterium]|nr:type 4a pilus biogenesis protein PilO [Candidatus Omnitrophota bacterium]